MNTMTPEEITLAIRRHKLYLNWVWGRAIDHGASLFPERWVVHGRQRLIDADLSNASLSYVAIPYSDLSCADFRGSKLDYANLTNSSLRDSKVDGASFRYAELSKADLRGIRFEVAGVTFENAELTGAKTSPNLDEYLNICPKGEFVAWKTVLGHTSNDTYCRARAKLLIPADALRSNATGRKCRASYAHVLEIVTVMGESVLDGISEWDSHFTYRVGKCVRPSGFDKDRYKECGRGIHFYLTPEECDGGNK